MRKVLRRAELGRLLVIETSDKSTLDIGVVRDDKRSNYSKLGQIIRSNKLILSRKERLILEKS
jgi:hypothetical protein